MGSLVSPESGGAGYEVDLSQDGLTLLRLSGELDLATIEELKTAVEPTIAAARSGLVVDIADVRFADSSAIAMWVSWSRHVPDFEIRHASAFIRRVIEAMGLSDVLRVS